MVEKKEKMYFAKNSFTYLLAFKKKNLYTYSSACISRANPSSWHLQICCHVCEKTTYILPILTILITIKISLWRSSTYINLYDLYNVVIDNKRRDNDSCWYSVGSFPLSHNFTDYGNVIFRRLIHILNLEFFMNVKPGSNT